MRNRNKHSDEKKSNKNQSDNASTMSKLVDSVGMSTSSHKFIRERGVSAQNEHRTGAGWSTLDAQHQSIFGHSFYTTYEKYYSEKFDEIEKLSNEEEKSRSLKNIKPLDIWLKDYVVENKDNISNVYTQVASVDNPIPNLHFHASDSGLHITHSYTQVLDFQQNEISEKEKLILAINNYLDVLKKESKPNSSSPQLFSYTDGGKEENMNALLALLKVVKGENELVTLDQYKGVLTQGKLGDFYQASLDIIQQPVRKNTP